MPRKANAAPPPRHRRGSTGRITLMGLYKKSVQVKQKAADTPGDPGYYRSVWLSAPA